jgi:hypothetical protein
MSGVLITIGDLRFDARFEERAAPRTCAAFRTLMPFEQRLVQARFSGEAAWVPLGDLSLDIPAENAKGEPQPGELLFYPGGVSETELLFPYGTARFACKAGPLAGNHFMTLTSGLQQLQELGRRVLWEGAQTIRIVAA